MVLPEILAALAVAAQAVSKAGQALALALALALVKAASRAASPTAGLAALASAVMAPRAPRMRAPLLWRTPAAAESKTQRGFAEPLGRLR